MIHQFIACKELFSCKIFPSVSDSRKLLVYMKQKWPHSRKKLPCVSMSSCVYV